MPPATTTIHLLLTTSSIFLLAFRPASSYSAGGENVVPGCGDMTPQHEQAPQDGQHPYAFEAKQEEDGGKWKVEHVINVHTPNLQRTLNKLPSEL